MRNILLIKVMLLLVLTGEAWAQSRTVTGKVSDGAAAQGLPGVTVLVKGTQVGTSTDVNGAYSIQVPASGTTLVFTFVGYNSIERAIGNATNINVALAVDAKQLSEVVVTAIGIERQKREVNYGVQQIGSEQLAQKSEPNLVNALQGKVAGVEIISSNGTPGAGTQIFIRGISSATGNNQPLFVIDGIPIDNSTNYTGNPATGGAAYSNRGVDLNPNDIESMTVLKGPAAAALYGSRAGNGAIIITTKKGKAGDANKKYEVTVTSSLNLQEVSGLPKYQNAYGQGTNGRYSNSVTDSWGPRFGTPGVTTVPNVTGNPLATLEYQAYEDNVKDFFNTGKILDNGLQLAGSGNNTRYIFSVNNTNQSGILPNSGLNRTSLRAGGSATLSHGLTVDASIIYTRTSQDGALQGNSGSSIWFTLPFIPRSIDLKNLPYKLSPGVQAPSLFSQASRDNPMWSVNESFYESEVNRVITSATVNYTPEFLKGLTFTYRAGLDQYSDARLEAYAYGSLNSNSSTAANRKGSQQYDNYNYLQVNQDFFGVYSKELSPSLSLRALIGTQINQIKKENRYIRAEDLIIPEFYNLSNHTNTTIFPSNSINERRLVGTYGQLSLGYKNWLFAEFQARNDWSSTLPKGKNSYFYPAVSAGFVFTDALQISNSILSYGKLRANYAQVGNDADPYLTNTVFITQGFGNNVNSISFPFNGSTAALTRSNRLGNMQLEPEFKKSYEIGSEFTFFDGKATLDVNYFKNSTTQQIFNVTIPGSTGFTTVTSNAGQIDNKGWEISAGVSPVNKQDGFRWDINTNFTKIKSLVVALAPGLNQFNLTTGSGGAGFTGLSPTLIPGLPFGVIQASTYLRNADGKFVINPLTGLPVNNSTPQVVGDPNPEWSGSVFNNFQYKGFNLGLMLQYTHGGDLYSRQTQIARLRGAIEETAEDRERPYMFDGVLANADGTPSASPNNIQITAQEYWTALNNANEWAVFDASVLRLREITLGYSLPAAMLEKTPFGSANISITGRNLFYYAPNLPHVDPEVNQLGGNTRGFEFNAPPSVKNYGVNLKFSF